MKKYLKLLSIFLVSIAVVFIGVSNVEADDCSGYPTATVGGDKYTVTGSSFNSCSRGETKEGNKLHLYQIDSGTAANQNMVIKNGSNTIKDVTFYRHDWDEKLSSLSGPIYCLNADLLSHNELYASRFSFLNDKSLKPADPTTPSYAYDVAILHILKNGSAGNFEQYFATSLAVRAVSAMFGYIESDSKADTDLERAYYGQTYNWVTYDANVKASYDLLKGGLVRDNSFGDALAGYSSYKFEARSTGAQATLDSAKSLVASALAATVEHLQNASEGSEITTEVGTSYGEKVEEERLEGIYIKQEITHSIVLNNFDKIEEPEFIIDSLAYNADYGTDGDPKIVKLVVGSNTFCESEEECEGIAIIGHNLLASVTTFSIMPIHITVEVGGYKTVNEGYSFPKIKCGEQPLEYTLNYHHNGGGTASAYEGDLFIVWRNQEDTSINQKFVSLLSDAEMSETDPEDVPGTFNASTTLIEECDCEYLWGLCKARNDITSEECQDYLYNCDDCEFLEDVCRESGDLESIECQVYFAEDCDDCDVLKVQCDLGMEEACTTYEEECEIPPAECNTEHTDTTNCCDDDNDLIISLEDKVKYEIHGNIKSEIKNCFVDQVEAGAEDILDDVGNSYQMLTDDRVVDNPYCKVHCREDYIMQLPAAKRVNAGRYFTFQASMEAAKQCFTSRIDKEQYIIDYQAALEMMISGFNKYQRFYYALNHGAPKETERGEVPTSCSGGGTDTCGTIGTEEKAKKASTTKDYTYKNYRIEWDNTFKDISELVPIDKSGPETKELEGSKSTCGSLKDSEGNETCGEYWSKITFEPTTTNFEAYLKKEMTDGKEMFDKGKLLFETAVDNYKGCSEWETEYGFDPVIEYYYDEKYSELALPDEMDADINVDSTDYSYCIENWEDLDVVDVNDTYERCGSGFGGDSTITLRFAKCELGTGGTCDFLRIATSKSIFKKSNTDADATYKPKSLFYNIYPSGKISVEGKMSSEEKDNSVLLKEKLPVALDTKKGIYNYTLEISNIGEYYDREGEQGRFVGGPSPIIEELKYVCSYLVNIWYSDSDIKCDAEGNPPKCEGSACEGACIGPSCEDLFCEGIDCVSDCVGFGCIYDRESGLSLYEKEVSVYELFPNGTKAYNWGNGTEAANEKANETIKDIETAGTSIYEQEPILSITIGPEGTSKIKRYNDENDGTIGENKGGYKNATLRCRDVGSYEKVGCYSSFIDDVLSGEYGTVNSNSTILDERTGADTGDGGYFKLWPGTISEEEMVGPSWQ